MKTEGVYTAVKPGRVIFGQPACDVIFAEAERLDAKKVAVFCSASLDKVAGLSTILKSTLGDRLAGIFTDIPAHTPRQSVLAGAAFVRDVAADFLVSIGGGSVIDGVKAIQLAVTECVDTEEELAAYSRGPSQPVPLKKAGPSALRQIAVPTTLSGAEFTPFGGVTNAATKMKEGYDAPDGIPLAVIFDPELCLHTPAHLWLSSAIRSVDHACEGYCSPDTFPYLDAQYLAALRLLAPALRATKADPQSAEARLLAQQGVWTVSAGVGAVATGASHGLGYILGALGVPHGETSCVLLPAVLEWNASVNGERQAALSEALGQPELTAAEAVRNLVSDLGLPTTLKEVGIAEEQFSTIAEHGAKHPTVLGNPREISAPSDILEILALAQ